MMIHLVFSWLQYQTGAKTSKPRKIQSPKSQKIDNQTYKVDVYVHYRHLITFNSSNSNNTSNSIIFIFVQTAKQICTEKKTIWRKKPTSNKTKQNYNWRRLAKEVGSISAQHILLYPNQQYHKYLWTTIIYHHVTDWLFDCCRLYLFNQKKKFLLPLKTTIKNVYFCLLSQMNI